MATLYFNGTVDSEWTELGNWWTDNSFTTQANSLPSSADSIIVFSDILSNNNSQPTIINLTINSGSFGIEISVSGTATFNNNSTNNGAINGNTIFNHFSINYGSIIGNATFNNSSYIEPGGTVVGNATFTGDTYHYDYGYSGVTGQLTFSSESTLTFIVNSWDSDISTWNFTNNIEKYWIFNAGGMYGGYISGTLVTFNNNTQHMAGTIDADVIFNNSAYNTNGLQGVINGNVIFNNTSYNNGLINGNVTFNNESYNSYDINGDVTFNNSSYNDDIINGNITFNNHSYNKRNITAGNVACNRRPLGIANSSILGMT